jgi:hypothetical protein
MLFVLVKDSKILDPGRSEVFFANLLCPRSVPKGLGVACENCQAKYRTEGERGEQQRLPQGGPSLKALSGPSLGP